MNRRTFLSALAATSLTPLVPPQIFAAGRILNPDRCGFVDDVGPELFIPMQSRFIGIADRPSWAGMSPEEILCDINSALSSVCQHDASVFIVPDDPIYEAFVYGDGTGFKSGLITT